MWVSTCGFKEIFTSIMLGDMGKLTLKKREIILVGPDHIKWALKMDWDLHQEQEFDLNEILCCGI